MADMTKLLADARNYLDVTWEDAEGDQKLLGILNRGMAYLDHLAGLSLNYETEDKPKELLLDYTRYVRANALEDFQKNYLSELLTLQIRAGVGDFD